jgi:ribosomal protein S15P/S13E
MAENNKNLSIHPRVWMKGEKKNTMKRPNPDIIKRKIAAIKEHLDRHPYDNVSKNHIQLLEKKL